ncbi:MAG: ROK family protein [Candidatus Peregrinibacteria bacterium]
MPETLHIVAGDLGGTHCRTAVVAYDGETPHLLENTYASWRSKEERDLDVVLERGIGQTIRSFRGRIHGTILAVAGTIPDHRTMREAANTACLHDIVPYNIADELARRFGVESFAANDVEAACAGEVAMGALKGVKDAMFENIGSGWGGAVVENGVTYAAEPGHTYLPGDGTRCGCGRTDCAETAVNIERRVRALHERGKIRIPDEHLKNPCAFSDRKAEWGTPWAVQLYTEIARIIGNVWGSRLNLRPHITHIGYQGSTLECAMRIGFFCDEVKRAMRERSLFPEHADVPILGVAAPRHPSEAPLGPLYGTASIWKRLHEERRGNAETGQ